jgi:hypothetical protein
VNLKLLFFKKKKKWKGEGVDTRIPWWKVKNQGKEKKGKRLTQLACKEAKTRKKGGHDQNQNKEIKFV